MNKVAYIGNKLRIAEEINELKEYEVEYAICQKDKTANDDDNTDFTVLEVSSKAELTEILRVISKDIDFAIMYDFGIIIPQEAIDIIPIYNFHPGNLRNNRGSSPIHWSILLDMKTTTMSLYQITTDIDAGEIVCEHDVKVYEHDVPRTLRYRLEGEIPSMLLVLAEYQTKHRAGEKLNQGIYRKRIAPEDYTILPSDTEALVKAKIRSQYDYDGAIVRKGDSIIRVHHYEEYINAIRK